MNRFSVHSEFRAPWGRTVTVVSILASALLLAIPLWGIWIAKPERTVAQWTTMIVPLLVLGGTALFAVRGYAIEGRRLVVRRLGWSTRIPLDSLESVAIDPDAMKRSLRVAGNGGVFAWVGWFRNKRLGTYRAFVTDARRCVVLRLPKRPVVVSPDRPEEFVRAVESAVGLD